MAKSYVVANPRGIPAGNYIIRTEDKRWYEGDAVEPTDFTKPVWKRWLDGGFVVVEAK